MNTINPQNILSKTANYKLSSSYPSMRPLTSSDNWKNGLFSFNNKKLRPLDNSVLTKSWGNYDNKLANGDLNSDLTSLSWLEKRRLIDIEPLDIEDEKDNAATTPGEDDLLNTNLSHAKVEVGSQENVHDFVRYAEMRNSANKYRSTGNVYDQPYQHSANGYIKPNLSYTQLIFLAIETCRDRAMTVNDIYQWCEVNYPYYKYIGPSWKNSLRHNLSINKSFKRMPREGQGGPGRGAYWIVDDKERPTLLESIYRTHQQQVQQQQHHNHGNNIGQGNNNSANLPVLSDRSNSGNNNLLGGTQALLAGMGGAGKTTISAISPELALLLRAAGLTATTNNTQFGDTEIPLLNSLANNTGGNNGLIRLHNGSDENKNQDTGNRGVLNPNDPDLALSASYNSTISKLDGYCPSADSPGQSRHELIDGENAVIPRVKNRRKSKHEKIRSIAEIEKLLQQKTSSQYNRQTAPNADDSHAVVSSNSSSSENNMSFHGNSLDSPNHNSATTTTTVNVIVAPHFDHMYARYQHFLPPAIPSDMDKKAYGQRETSSHKRSHDDGDDMEGEYDEDYDDLDEEDDDESLDEEFLNRRRRYDEGDEDECEGEQGKEKLGVSGTSIKTEKLDPSEEVDLLNSSFESIEKKSRFLEVNKTEPTVRNGYESDETLPMITNGRSSSNDSSLASRKRRRKPMKTTKLVSTTSTSLITALSLQSSSSNSTATTSDDNPSKHDSLNNNSANKEPVNQGSVNQDNNSATALALNRSKRKRFKTTRIDDKSEQAAVEFLACQLKQKTNIMKNIDNLYQFLDEIQLAPISPSNTDARPSTKPTTRPNKNKTKTGKRVNGSNKKVLTQIN